MAFQVPDLLPKAVRKGNIIGIHASDVLASGQVNPLIEPSSEALVQTVVDHAQSRIVETLHYLGATVGRAIIQYQHLQRSIGLREQRI